ncbi:DUF29 domain-containing protein [Synechocystis sp. PCC 7338]|nr:DUF29 domain-containing protein [Synechocystis sp. PCC 7338]
MQCVRELSRDVSVDNGEEGIEVDLLVVDTTQAVAIKQYQPERQGNSRQATIREQRRQIDRLLHKNSGLKGRWQEAWLDGRDLAIRETGLDESILPETPCFNAEQVRDEGYWP